MQLRRAERLPTNILVSLISQDPYFLFVGKSLLGRDRRSRVYITESSLESLKVQQNIGRTHVILCDLDTVVEQLAFCELLQQFVEDLPHIKILCLGEGVLGKLPSQMGEMRVNGLLSKQDLGYCLHLAVHAVVDSDLVLLSKRSRAVLRAGSYLWRNGQLIGPQKRYPGLTERLLEIVIMRALTGLDNPDIQDELLIGKYTVREHVSKAYRIMGVSNEFQAFEVLSTWWWETRFSEIVSSSAK